MSRGFVEQLPNHERRRILALLGVDHEEFARRRLDGEPLQYLEGSAAFVDFSVEVDRRVLIPRPETEGLYELAAESVRTPEVIVDLGTGSGVLAIALQRRFAGARVHAVELSDAAIQVAKGNALALDADVSFHHGDLFDALPGSLRGRVDLIVSNPPYVAEAEWDHLPVDVRHEPREALVAGPTGMEVLDRIAAGAGEWLRPGGVVVCEIGETQGEATLRGFVAVGPAAVHADLSSRSRYVLARKPAPGWLEPALEALRTGEVVGVPTDTVYGLAVDPWNEAAVGRLFALKGRPDDRPVGLLAASRRHVEEMADLGSGADLAEHWPGPLTLVVRPTVMIPDWIGTAAVRTVGIRVPDHDDLRVLLSVTGPLAVTSANLSGQPEALDEAAARATFGDGVAMYVPGRAPGGTASTVVDVTTDQPRVLRPGPLHFG